MAEAVHWGKRGARINTISPGIIITPLANDELSGPRGPGYRRMIELCPVGRAGTPDEVGNVAALLMGSDGAFITGSDFLMDGGVTAAYWFGELDPSSGRGSGNQTEWKSALFKGPEQYFIGGVRVDSLCPTSEAPLTGATVTLEPGARSAWHRHPFGQPLRLSPVWDSSNASARTESAHRCLRRDRVPDEREALAWRIAHDENDSSCTGRDTRRPDG